MTKNIDDGGPVYPCKTWEQVSATEIDGEMRPEYAEADHYGIKLRDWFAGQSLLSCGSFWSDAETRRTYAKRAYQMADALIKARNGEL